MPYKTECQKRKKENFKLGRLFWGVSLHTTTLGNTPRANSYLPSFRILFGCIHPNIGRILHFFPPVCGRNTARCVRSSPIPTLPPVCLSVRFLSFLLRMVVHILSGVSSSLIQTKGSNLIRTVHLPLPHHPSLFFRKRFWDTEPISRICHLLLTGPPVHWCTLIRGYDCCPIFHVLRAAPMHMLEHYIMRKLWTSPGEM